MLAIDTGYYEIARDRDSNSIKCWIVFDVRNGETVDRFQTESDAMDWMDAQSAAEMIAEKTFGRGLISQNSDRLDFVELHVDTLRNALASAYFAGLNAERS